MRNPESIHIDVFFSVKGVDGIFPVGHGDVAKHPDPSIQAGRISTLLHELAWGYEEAGQRVARNSEAIQDFKPRKARTSSGDLFFEVRPDKFVHGMSFDDAVDSYNRFGGHSELKNLQTFHKNLIVEDLGD